MLLRVTAFTGKRESYVFDILLRVGCFKALGLFCFVGQCETDWKPGLNVAVGACDWGLGRLCY